MVVELFLSVVAGAATAVAATRINSLRAPRIPIVGANLQIKSEIHTLDAQKRILEKSIARLYTDTMNLTTEQRNELIIRYQNQLGIINVQSEKLVEAARHPDFGTLGDSLVTILDKKLSGLEEKFGELSAKIPTNTVPSAKPKKTTPERVPQPNVNKIPVTPLVIPDTNRRVELTTLTEVPLRSTEPFAPLPPTSYVPSQVTPEPIAPASRPHQDEPVTPAVKRPVISEPPKAELTPSTPVVERPVISEPPKAETKVIDVPPRADPPIIVPPDLIDQNIDDDDDSISKIKNDIQKALKKMDQAEVE